MIRPPKQFETRGIIVEIVEVMEYRDMVGRMNFLVAYRIIDGHYVSPVAHFSCSGARELREKIEQVADHYFALKPVLRGAGRTR
ncbi:MAG: hypothetical protein BA066_07340 [Candidatus Korarchaeota archaeon NZ13-K]|nr:MAG: hypothetical protein BA066_07340 [Candidatus Korarchaeota archaeon NZ13-K]